MNLRKQLNSWKFYLFMVAAAIAVAPAPAWANEIGQGLVASERVKCKRSQPIETEVLVERVVDGDTVLIRAEAGVYSVRMLGIDTPETHYFGHHQGRWADAASARLKEILPVRSKVRIELAPEKCDSYGRVLAHIFKGRTHVNAQMVKEGLAVTYCIAPSVAHCERLGLLVGGAIEKRLGMFSDSNVELPYDFRRRVSNRPRTSYVGSMKTKQVVAPVQQDYVPVPERIFFLDESNIVPPYHRVD